jgi:hypothetical protein
MAEGVPQKRLLSVDLARGITMFMMIMIDNQGSFSNVWWLFNESDWVGIGTADCVFPTVSMSSEPFKRVRKAPILLNVAVSVHSRVISHVSTVQGKLRTDRQGFYGKNTRNHWAEPG